MRTFWLCSWCAQFDSQREITYFKSHWNSIAIASRAGNSQRPHECSTEPQGILNFTIYWRWLFINLLVRTSEITNYIQFRKIRTARNGMYARNTGGHQMNTKWMVQQPFFYLLSAKKYFIVLLTSHDCMWPLKMVQLHCAPVHRTLEASQWCEWRPFIPENASRYQFLVRQSPRPIKVIYLCVNRSSGVRRPLLTHAH